MNLDPHFPSASGTQDITSLAQPTTTTTLTGAANAPYYQNFYQSSQSIEKDILDDLYKILNSADASSSEFITETPHPQTSPSYR